MARLKEKNDIIQGNLDPKHWVQKSDPLVLMSTVPFSLGELKILDTYISRINAADDTRRTVIFTKEEYENLMGISCANPRSLSKHIDGLLGKIVTLKMPDHSFFKFVLFTKSHYYKDEYGKPIIEVTCSEEAKELFFCISKYHYFKYALENVINLTHKASYLLYLHVFTNRFRGEWEVSVDELRDTILDCKEQESYKEYKIFKNRVLDPAVKEVNKKTDCQFTYKPIKRGRWVIAIQFNIITIADKIVAQADTTKPKQQLSLLDEQEKEIDYGSDLANLLGSAACNDEFDPKQIRVIQDLVLKAAHTRDHMELCDFLIHRMHLMDYRNSQQPIHDRFSYLCTMLRNEIEKQ